MFWSTSVSNFMLVDKCAQYHPNCSLSSSTIQVQNKFTMSKVNHDLHVSTAVRGYIVRKQLYLIRKGRDAAAVFLQKMVRGFLQRRSYKIRWQVMVQSAVLLQRGRCDFFQGFLQCHIYFFFFCFCAGQRFIAASSHTISLI